RPTCTGPSRSTHPCRRSSTSAAIRRSRRTGSSTATRPTTSTTPRGTRPTATSAWSSTPQLGELPGLHHGTYREGMWWWQSRGYTPAGVEAWNGIRGIDYLVSRPEVDKTKIAVTGRSGGGATSWWLGAIDDRIAAVVPVAGIT